MQVGFHRFIVHEEDNQNSPENNDESPLSPRFHDIKATSTSSPKRSRRGTKKRVVHVPIKEVKGSRLRAETNAPPSDSWTWRKYGQKPIKGSPYPRGYYRCSSSKGCPARKQVERSWTDPTMVMVTYSCEHNHPWPASRNNNHHHRDTLPSPSTTTEATNSNVTDDQLEEEEEEETPIQSRRSEPESKPKPQQKFTSLEVGSCGPFEPPVQTRPCQLEREFEPHQKVTSPEVGSHGPIFSTTLDQYEWFSDLDSTSPIMLESPLMAGDMVEDNDMATILSIRDDEESFFADLGELPECTTVFKRREVVRAEEHHRNLATWCGTTG